MKRQVQVCLGSSAKLLGRLSYVKEGSREYSAFSHDGSWLAAPDRFEFSPDLPLVAGHQVRRAPMRDDSVFHHAFADTEPDTWSRRVIARAHVKARRHNADLPPLTAFDQLLAVDDFSRVGALRLRDESGGFLGSTGEGERSTPPLVDLSRLFDASRAVEAGRETEADLHYLQGKGTSLGGMRPKCTVLDVDGSLAIGKFPSLHDQRAVERGEVLALRLAAQAGIEASDARVVMAAGTPVAVITRFDRTATYARIPYLSAASLIQASRQEDRSYTELADAMRSRCAHPKADLQQLWRRLLFNLLITNVDDHLQNLGFLHVGHGQWRLAPAFDLNPFPDKDRESKTWLSETTGPITTLAMLMAEAARFGLHPNGARQVLDEVHKALRGWRRAARSKAVGLSVAELDDFATAFEHSEQRAAAEWLARS